MRQVPDKVVVQRLKELTSLSDSEIKEVALAGTSVHVPANWTLIWEKTPADAAYYILDGEVSIQRNREEVATLVAGEFIGELAIMNHQLRSASVITKTEVTALNFSAEAGRKLADGIPRIREALESTSAGRLEVDRAE